MQRRICLRHGEPAATSLETHGAAEELGHAGTYAVGPVKSLGSQVEASAAKERPKASAPPPLPLKAPMRPSRPPSNAPVPAPTPPTRAPVPAPTAPTKAPVRTPTHPLRAIYTKKPETRR